ncbi:MAG: hypothetical protein IJO62_01330 [Clostridia bacterium]|nr:hypothetical protein [Clostridia bacterium]
MDFFENAVSKAKDVFDVACKKTGEVVNTGKQKLDIATLENKMAKDFERLGRVYFEQIKDADGLDEATAKIKNAILEKQSEINKIKEEMEN